MVVIATVPAQDGVESLKAKTGYFQKMVQVLKMNVVGKVNSKLQCVKGILKVNTNCMLWYIFSNHFSSKEMFHMYYTVC